MKKTICILTAAAALSAWTGDGFAKSWWISDDDRYSAESSSEPADVAAENRKPANGASEPGGELFLPAAGLKSAGPAAPPAGGDGGDPLAGISGGFRPPDLPAQFEAFRDALTDPLASVLDANGKTGGKTGNGNTGTGTVNTGTGAVDKNLSARIMKRASGESVKINRTGGYRFDGYNDCYGFVRRAWDPELGSMRRPRLPVSDYPSRNWAPVTSWSALIPGDVLSTRQGHAWGAHWHGGLFSGYSKGTVYIFDNSGSRDGAYVRAMPPGLFHYYYIPTHKLLSGQSGKK